MEATPWFLHAYSKKTPHKPNFSQHPGERPVGYVTEPPRALYRKGPPLLLETLSGPRPPSPGPASPLPSLARVGSSLHATARRDLASITEPGHLWPGEAGNARCSDDGSFSVGHALVLLAFLKAPHVCKEGRCRGQKVNPVSGTGRRENIVKRMILKKGHPSWRVPHPIRCFQPVPSPGCTHPRIAMNTV